MDSDRRQRLEERISRLGRERVFDYVEAIGWGRGSNPPIYVFEDACRAIEEGESQ